MDVEVRSLSLLPIPPIAVDSHDSVKQIGDLIVNRSSTASANSVGTSQRSAQLNSVQSTSLTLKPFRAPAPAKATNPLALRVASGSPERARSSRAQTPLETLKASLPPGSARFKLPGLASMSVVSSSSAYGIKEVRKGARFDPQAEGAIVMRRPNDEHQEIYNKKCVPSPSSMTIRSCARLGLTLANAGACPSSTSSSTRSSATSCASTSASASLLLSISSSFLAA